MLSKEGDLVTVKEAYTQPKKKLSYAVLSALAAGHGTLICRQKRPSNAAKGDLDLMS